MPRSCRVFDDKISILHLIVPLLVTLLGLEKLLVVLWVGYVFYEVVEGRYRRDCPEADLLEFLVGTGMGYILKICLKTIGLLGA